MTNPNELRKRAEIAGEDYAQEMFRDGHDRVDQDKTVIRAKKGYDEAAHSGKVETPELDISDTLKRGNNPARPAPRDTAHSRDGTDSVGEYDENGGSPGGTEKELDDMEAAGTPVDRQMRMKG